MFKPTLKHENLAITVIASDYFGASEWSSSEFSFVSLGKNLTVAGLTWANDYS